MNKKIVLISLLVIVLTVSISGCINFSDLSKIVNMVNEKTVTVGGVDFKVPGNFNEKSSEEGMPSTWFSNIESMESYSFLEDENDYINITVYKFDSVSDAKEAIDWRENYYDMEPKTINNVNGLFINITEKKLSDDPKIGTKMFAYRDGDKFISIETSDESLLNHVISQ